MQPERIRELLETVKSGSRSVDDAFKQLAELPFTDIGNAKIDNHRPLRSGFAEVVLCRGKEPHDVVRIMEEGLRHNPLMLATRAEKRHVDAVRERFPNAIVNTRGGTVRVGEALKLKTRGTVMVVTAGTGDIPVAEEALETLRAFGCEALHNYDVGVAGLHRVLSALPQLRQAAVIVCVAGMEGALPSVLGGLVACPVIAVPSSIGYGASFNGLAALLGMLNTCSAGVTVVNIDNGFGAAMSALKIVAERDWPVVEVPAKTKTVSAQEVEAVKSAGRDAQLVRLESAVDRLATMSNKPVVVESPKIEIMHPNQTEQVARLEKAIAELAAFSAKQREFDTQKQTTKSTEQSDLVSRLEKTAQNLATMSNKPVVVESPKIEIMHPSQTEQVARLEKAIAELAAFSAKQREFDTQKQTTKSTEQNDLVSRLEKTAQNLATMSNKPVVVESPKIEIMHPSQTEQVARLEKAITELAAFSAKQRELDAQKQTTKSTEQNDLVSRLEKTAQSLATMSNKPVVVESPKIEINHPSQTEQVARLEKAITELAAFSTKQRELDAQKQTTKSAEQNELVERLEKTAQSLNTMSNKPVVVESPKIEILHPSQTEQVARLEKSIADLAAFAAKQNEYAVQQRPALTAAFGQAALLDKVTAELQAVASKQSGVDAEWLARLEKIIEHLAGAAAKQIVVEVKTPPPPPPREFDDEQPEPEPEGKPKSPVVKHAAKSKKSGSHPRKGGR